MLVDTGLDHADFVARRKIGRALCVVGVKKEQRICHRAQPAAAQRPIGNFVVDFFHIHVPDILRVVAAAQGIGHTVKLPVLLHNIADITALADAKKFTVGHGGTVHYNRSDCPHAVVTLAQPYERTQVVSLIKYDLGIMISDYNMLDKRPCNRLLCFHVKATRIPIINNILYAIAT